VLDESKGYVDSAVASSMGRRAGPPLPSSARGARVHLRRAGGSPALVEPATSLRMCEAGYPDPLKKPWRADEHR
jgi:hypothetical protein